MKKEEDLKLIKSKFKFSHLKQKDILRAFDEDIETENKMLSDVYPNMYKE